MIRAGVAADAGAIAAIYAPHVTDGAVSFEEAAPDAAAMAARMAASGGRLPWLVATDPDGAVLGYAFAVPFAARAAYRWTVETGIYLADAAQGRGIGRELYGALIETLARQGYAQAVARIALPGAASEALHRALGFTPIGVERGVGYKLGAWRDVALWQRALAPSAIPPAEPRAFAELAQPSWG